MKKRICLYTLCVLMVLAAFVSMLPLTAEADSTGYLIEQIHLRVEQPAAGYAPRFKAWVEENNPNYYLSDHAKTGFINGVSWKDNTTGQYLTEDDVFVRGHSYTVGVLCNAKTGYSYHVAKYEVSANYFVTTYVNGQEGSIGFGKYLAECSQSAAVYYTFTSCPNPPTPLTQVAVTGVKTPSKLESPDYDALTQDSRYRVCPEESNTMQRRFYNGVGWIRDLGGGYTYTMEPLEDTFVEGKVYRVSILLEAVHPYRFAVDAQGQPNVTATVKGITASVRDAYGYLDPSRYCIVTYQFPAVALNNYCRLDNIDITELDIPRPGRQPDYNASVTSGAKGRDTGTAYTKNGISWYDQTAGAYLKPTDTFTQGHIYRVELSLQASDGYIFVDDEYGIFQIAATVNNSAAATVNEHLGADKLQVQYTFPSCQNISLSQIDITVSEPTLGAKASYGVSLHQEGVKLQNRTDGYFEQGVAWWDNRENTYLIPGQRFAANRSYNLELYLEPEPGYTIANNVAVTVNGSAADAWGSGKSTWISFETPQLAKTTGWYQVGKDWVFFGAEGGLRTGWMQSGSIWYHFDSTGTMSVGWKEIAGKDYFFNASGAMVTGWLKQGGIWYYLKPGAGDVAIGWQEIGGKTYFFRTSGAMVTGSVEIDGKRYQFDSNGALIVSNKNSWVQENGKWYYYQNGGKKTGWIQVGGIWYYLKPSGEMVTGWLKYGNVWYYLKPSGAMQTGWLKYGAYWYHFDANGVMATGKRTVGGKTYQFDNSGICLNP